MITFIVLLECCKDVIKVEDVVIAIEDFEGGNNKAKIYNLFRDLEEQKEHLLMKNL